MKENPIYEFMKANKLTDKDEASFLKEYADSAKAKELHGFFQANKLTDKDFDSFYGTYLKGKDAGAVDVRSTETAKPDQPVDPSVLQSQPRPDIPMKPQEIRWEHEKEREQHMQEDRNRLDAFARRIVARYDPATNEYLTTGHGELYRKYNAGDVVDVSHVKDNPRNKDFSPTGYMELRPDGKGKLQWLPVEKPAPSVYEHDPVYVRAATPFGKKYTEAEVQAFFDGVSSDNARQQLRNYLTYDVDQDKANEKKILAAVLMSDPQLAKQWESEADAIGDAGNTAEGRMKTLQNAIAKTYGLDKELLDPEEFYGWDENAFKQQVNRAPEISNKLVQANQLKTSLEGISKSMVALEQLYKRNPSQNTADRYSEFAKQYNETAKQFNSLKNELDTYQNFFTDDPRNQKAKDRLVRQQTGTELLNRVESFFPEQQRRAAHLENERLNGSEFGTTFKSLLRTLGSIGGSGARLFAETAISPFLSKQGRNDLAASYDNYVGWRDSNLATKDRSEEHGLMPFVFGALDKTAEAVPYVLLSRGIPALAGSGSAAIRLIGKNLPFIAGTWGEALHEGEKQGLSKPEALLYATVSATGQQAAMNAIGKLIPGTEIRQTFAPSRNVLLAALNGDKKEFANLFSQEVQGFAKGQLNNLPSETVKNYAELTGMNASSVLTNSIYNALHGTGFTTSFGSPKEQMETFAGLGLFNLGMKGLHARNEANGLLAGRDLLLRKAAAGDLGFSLSTLDSLRKEGTLNSDHLDAMENDILQMAATRFPASTSPEQRVELYKVQKSIESLQAELGNTEPAFQPAIEKRVAALEKQKEQILFDAAKAKQNFDNDNKPATDELNKVANEHSLSPQLFQQLTGKEMELMPERSNGEKGAEPNGAPHPNTSGSISETGLLPERSNGERGKGSDTSSPNTDASPEGTKLEPSEIAKSKTIGDHLRNLANMVEGDKTVLHSDILALPKAVASTLLRGAALVADAGGSIADQIKHVVDGIREHFTKTGKALPSDTQLENHARRLMQLDTFATEETKASLASGEKDAAIESRLNKTYNLGSEWTAGILNEARELRTKEAIKTAASQMPAKKETSLSRLAEMIKSGFKKNFNSNRGLPDDWMAIKDEATGARNIGARNMRRAIDDLRKAMKEEKVTSGEDVATALALPSDNKNLALQSLPAKTKAAVVQMRAMVDGYSKSLVMNNLVTPEQADAINAHLGDYLTRAYKLHTDKEWFKKVPDAVKQDATNFLAQQHLNRLQSDPANNGRPETELINEAIALGKQDVQDILTRKENAAGQRHTELLSKDTSSLKKREDIPEPIRKLMGEYTDPVTQFAISISKLATLHSQATLLNRLKEQFKGTLFFDKNDIRPEGFNHQIAAEGSQAWSPLNGLYTNNHIMEALAENAGEKSAWERLYQKGFGLVKLGKTVYSLPTQTVNFLANPMISLANGHFRLSELGKSFKYWKDTMFNGERSQDEFIEAAVKHNVIGQSVNLRLIRDMLKNDKADEIAIDEFVKPKGKTLNPLSWLKGLDKTFQKQYAASDSFWKMYGFMNEAVSWSDALYSKKYSELLPDEKGAVNRMAAERIKNTYPTYDRALPGLLWLGKNVPFVGNFMAFQAEVLRNIKNNFSYAFKDLADPNAKVKALGAKRLAGIVSYTALKQGFNYFAATTSGHAVSSLWSTVFGTEDETSKRKALDRFAPDYLQTHNLVINHKGEGVYTVGDIDRLDPYNSLWQSLNAGFVGGEKSGIENAANTLATPFIEPDMLLQAAKEIIANENKFGYPIFNTADTQTQQLKDKLKYLWNVVEPTTSKYLNRVFASEDKAKEATQSLLNRDYAIDVNHSFKQKLRSAEGELKLNDSFNYFDGGEDPERFKENAKKILGGLHEDYKAALSLGVPSGTLDETLSKAFHNIREKKPLLLSSIYDGNVSDELLTALLGSRSSRKTITPTKRGR